MIDEEVGTGSRDGPGVYNALDPYVWWVPDRRNRVEYAGFGHGIGVVVRCEMVVEVVRS